MKYKAHKWQRLILCPSRGRLLRVRLLYKYKQGPHAIVAKAFPHFGEEKSRKPPGVAEKAFSVAGFIFNNCAHYFFNLFRLLFLEIRAKYSR